ncbi:MAG: hypothetical protein AAF108_04110 [Planctomycetota bacterium]
MSPTPAALALSLLAVTHAAADDYYVYFLGGQSNMVGYGTVADLPADLTTPTNGAKIYNGKEHEDLTEPTGFGL